MKKVLIWVLTVIVSILVGRSTVSQQNEKIAWNAMKCLQTVYRYDSDFFYDVIVETDEYQDLCYSLGKAKFMPYWHVNP